MPRVSYPCLSSKCGKGVFKGIECEVCNRWAHPKCSGLSADVYSLYCQSTWAQWVCMPCKEAARFAFQRETRAVETSHGENFPDRSGTKSLPTAAARRSYAEVASTPAGTASSGRPGNLSVALSSTPVRQVVSGVGTKIAGKRKQPVKRPLANRQGKDSGVSHPELKALERHVMDLQRQIHTMNKAPGRRLLILNREEPYIREAKARREMDHRRVLDILRLAGILHPGGIKRVHRVGTFKAPNPNRNSPPARPILVEFVAEQTRDLLLARSVLVAQRTGGRYLITPDGPNGNHRERLSGREVGINPEKPHAPIQPRRTFSENRIAHLPGVSPGVVVIEDILEDEQWQSCLQEDNEGEKASPKLSKEPPTEVAHQAEPLATSNVEKNLLSPRVLRPRTKQEGSMGSV